MKTETVYRLWNEGLGDHWASLNLLAHMSAATGKEVLFTCSQAKQDRAHEILRVLDIFPQAQLTMHVNPDQAEGFNGFHVWATPYCRTKKRWARPSAEPYICVHFTGISSAADKNPSRDEIDRILEWAGERGVGVVSLGDGVRPISEIVDLLARCALFVGCDSGMSHIAHSVGCPTYLLEYQLPVVTCHRHKNYVLCRGAAHFAQQADNWMNFNAYLSSLTSPIDAP